MTTSGEIGEVVTLAVALASGTIVALAGQRDFTINREAASVATDTKGDTAICNSPTRQNVTCSVDCLYVHADAQQQRLITLMKTNSQCTLEILRDGSAFESATATITSLSVNHADKEFASFSVEFDIDGDFS